MPDARWISEREVVDAIDLAGAIGALERALALEATGGAGTMVKTHQTWGEGHTLHAIGGVLDGAGVVGTKTWAHTAGGANPLVVLWDARTGELRAVIEAFALGQLRTAGMSGVATRALALAGVRHAAVIGTGRQALPQAAALSAVLPLEEIRVRGRDPEKMDAFALKVEATLGIETIATDSVADAVLGAGVVTTVTRATTPVVSADMLEPGTHVNAVGAITPERMELAGDVLDRCDLVITDSIDQARSLAAELIDHWRDEPEAWAQVRSLSSLVAAGAGRPPDADLTLFKSLGIGLADVAIAAAVVERAPGRPIPQPERVAPRFVKERIGHD